MKNKNIIEDKCHNLENQYKLKSIIIRFNLAIRNKFKKLRIIILLIILLILLLFLKSFRVGLCVIGKNENLYVREFVEHYLKIGYNKIFIYDNNDKNGERFDEVINDYIQKKLVQIINFRERSSDSRPIFDAYKDCYSRNNNAYDWLSFFDMDEFLELNKKYKSIQDFLNDKIFKHCQNIKINWQLYKNDKNLYYENKPLQQRITQFEDNKHIKSTVRGNLPKNYWKNIGTPHTSTLNYVSCSSSGKLVQFDSSFIFPPDYSNAKLKHYYYKSFEEYCIKIKRGKSDFPLNVSNQIAYQSFKRLYESSKNNTEKLKIIKKIFNESIYELK